MTKVAQMTIPPEFQSLLDKILAYFDRQIYSTWATRNFHVTRGAQAANAAKTVLPKVADAWKLLTPVEKLAWKAAVGYTGQNMYQLFTSDFIYRRKNNMSLPGTPSATHQMHGLKISNPYGTGNIRVRLHLKDLIGPITISFDYKKGQNVPPTGESFNLTAQAYHFDGGLNILDQTSWVSPVGNVSWTPVSLTFGQSGVKYFHLIIEFKLDNYDANVFLDNFGITDYGGLFYGDSFVKKSGQEWLYEAFYRKQGWAFDPLFSEPFFEIVYLD